MFILTELKRKKEKNQLCLYLTDTVGHLPSHIKVSDHNYSSDWESVGEFNDLLRLD